MRLFLAFPLNKEIKNNIASRRKSLKNKPGWDKVKWEAFSKMHLTLKFIGETDKKLIPELAQSLSGVVSFFEPYEVEFKGTGVFPSEKRPRVFWVACHDRKNYTCSLKGSIDSSLEKIGFKTEKRKFVPHITIARRRHPKKAVKMARSFLNADICAGKMMVRELNLYQSILKPSGAEHKIVKSFPLAKPPN
ncbi:MAG: RNA 2',3'-cyclic phosphodiesterase [Elusimicrobiota bacterium]